ncbi:hypothetical protein AVL55_11115 [Alteromonas macleodii]|uniref:DNA 3'-5' helicase n=1 Tax=Alteromonas macleodii TaxID=28108 RepID=A0A126Q2K9_ALTMA|nr:UvrD-helicase domain-containing protein [Alteromonas macleodii]AMJ98668.1 hypothetical protein AVL55_11115 [Alteromonas macleodii]
MSEKYLQQQVDALTATKQSLEYELKGKRARIGQLESEAARHKDEIIQLEEAFRVEKNILQKKITELRTQFGMGSMPAEKSKTQENRLATNSSSCNPAKKSESILFDSSDSRLTKNLPAFKTYLENLQFKPTDEQSKMIFCSQRNAYVVAGAGSGKSTTLIQRVIFLVKVLKVPLEEITIFSFTKASVEEFQKSLKKKLKEASIPSTPSQIDTMVSTFHKKALAISEMGNREAFEFIGQSDRENKYASSLGIRKEKFSDKQVEVLKKAYQNGYNTDSAFRLAVDMLYLEEAQNYYSGNNYTGNPIDSDFIESQTAWRDKEVSIFIQNSILKSAEPLIPFPIIQGGRESKAHVAYANFKKIINGRVTYFIFNPERLLSDHEEYKVLNKVPVHYKDETGKEQSVILGQCQNLRRRWILHKSNQEVIFIDSLEAFRTLRGMDFESSTSAVKAHAPIFNINKVSIFMILFEHIGFMNNMAVAPNDIIDTADKHPILKENQKEKLIIKCAAHFHNVFHHYLHQNGFYAFDELFANKEVVTKLKDSELNSMRHLLIDEFQDISPQIAVWIQNIRYELKERACCADEQGSLMVVGDDYQSIYGWRGSSPDFFINYDKHFGMHSPVRVTLNTNFRSIQPIINDAEETLIEISDKYKIDKHGFAHPKTPSGAQGLIYLPCKADGKSKDELEVIAIQSLIETDIFKSYIANSSRELQLEQESSVSGSNKERTLFILSRENGVLAKAKEELKDIRRKANTHIDFHTFHGSKGLEADDVILIGDCDYRRKDIIRNFIYELSGQPQTYDDAQKDEASRLAYVAITRAKQRIAWIGQPTEEGVMNKFREKDSSPPPIKRKLQTCFRLIDIDV